MSGVSPLHGFRRKTSREFSCLKISMQSKNFVTKYITMSILYCETNNDEPTFEIFCSTQFPVLSPNSTLTGNQSLLFIHVVNSGWSQDERCVDSYMYLAVSVNM